MRDGMLINPSNHLHSRWLYKKSVMKKILGIIVGGYVGLLFPVAISIILLEKLHHLLLPLNHWIESTFHISRLVGVFNVLLISVLILLLLGYLCGLLIRSEFVKKQMKKYEEGVLARIPVYNLIKSVLYTESGISSDDNFRPALLEEGDLYSLCYVTNESEHFYAVYVSEGGLSGGNIQLVPKDKVKILNIGLPEFTRLVKQYGVNSAQLAERIYTETSSVTGPSSDQAKSK